VKVLATNLSPYTTYYYRFAGPGTNNYSHVGRTKTAPLPSQAISARFAVLNCEDYIGRYYNTLAHLVLNESNQCDFVVDIGDYIYETTGDPSFQATNGPRSIVFNDLAGARQLGTPAAPFYAAASLDNYRQLYRTYTSDPNLTRVRELFPLVAMWDDHEYANDAWGATSTDFNGKTNEYNLVRKHNAEQAFYEYLPISIGLDNQGVQVDASILYPNTKIYRNLQYGSLLDIYLTDYRT
jgi:alkaline phosphatase D